jgi:hypothetical protein
VTALRLRSDCAAIALRLHCDCAATSKRFQSAFKAIAKKSQSDFKEITKKSQSDRAILYCDRKRFQSDKQRDIARLTGGKK